MSAQRKVSELHIAVDTGGTFTDCVWVENGRLRMLKVFSTPDDPSRAIAKAVSQVMDAAGPRAANGMEAGRPRPALVLLHGTTVGTNTILQRKGARIAFVTTSGFEDTIEIGRQARPKLYDFFFDKVEPLVPSELRFGVPERITSEAEVLKSPSPSELKQLADNIRQAKPEAVAISLLFSFANPENELSVAKVLKMLGVPLSISHQLLPEFREYERASTVVINAYLQPIMERYLTNLGNVVDAGRPRPANARVFVMQSSGGITAVVTAAREPVRTVLSGPAGGIVGAAAMAKRSGFDKIITFDMGGTSTDVALVSGDLKTTNEGEIAGLPIRVPTLDIHTVGAGGGSIARFDAGGALRVGPESAGADPGPICYGRGEQPTVTDANLLLGRLRPDQFLGGSFTLDRDRTCRLVSDWLKRRQSSLSLEAFATGLIRVVNSNMEKAIRVVSIERGYDSRDFALVAFGGAGGLHACELARSLGIPTVIVPAMPGALSAYGILVSDIVKDFSRTVLMRVTKAISLARLNAEYRHLAHLALTEFRSESWKGKVDLQRSADLRYRGQGFELNVPFGPGIIDAFHDAHQRRYGYCNPGREVEIVTLRLRASIRGSREGTFAQERRKPEKHVAAMVSFDGKLLAASISSRDSLRPNVQFRGPAVITEYSATTVVPPRSTYYLDRAANLIIQLPAPTKPKARRH